MAGKLTPKAAIKAFCMECVCGQRDEIRLCTGTKCPLFELRPFKSAGKTPASSKAKSTVKQDRGQKIMTEAHKAKMKAAKAAKRTEREAAGLSASGKVKKVKEPVKNTKKSAAAAGRMTDEQKAKMRAGRQAKAAERKAGYVEVAMPRTPKAKAVATRTVRGH